MKEAIKVVGIVDICVAIKTRVTEENKTMQVFTRNNVHGTILKFVTNEKQPQFKM